MSDTTKKILNILCVLVVLTVSVILTVVGQRNIGPAGLGLQLLGILGLIFLLWNYNRKFK